MHLWRGPCHCCGEGGEVDRLELMLLAGVIGAVGDRTVPELVQAVG